MGERSLIGDREGDTVIGGGRKEALLTLAERKPCLLLLGLMASMQGILRTQRRCNNASKRQSTYDHI